MSRAPAPGSAALRLAAPRSAALWLAAPLVLLGDVAPVHAQDAPFPVGELSPLPERDAALIELGRAIRAAAERRDTNHAVFHGCIDWHSAVHAHWALLRIARVTGQAEEQAAWVEARLTPAGIAREAALLRAKPRFENPYGRAWFLRLALEFEAWAGARGVARAERLRATADEVAAGLLARYRKLGFDPIDEDYLSASWALTQLHAWLTHRADPAAAEVAALVAAGTTAAADLALDFGEDRERPGFFSRYGGWAYAVAHTQDREALAAFLAAHAPGDLAVCAPLPKRAHHLGMVWSRAWALRALTRRLPAGEPRRACDRAYRDHVRQGLAQHTQFAADYRAYGHWVPQFAVYALTEGEPARRFH